MKTIKPFLVIILLSLVTYMSFGQTNILNPKYYGTANWNSDSLGNHRVVIHVNSGSDMVFAHMEWRRRDFNPEKKGIIILDATTGKRITDILPVNVNREFGDIIFHPETVPGNYYVYYLKYISNGRSNYPNNIYPPFHQLSSKVWLSKAKAVSENLNKIPSASLVQFQSINEFNSFYPMEIIATKKETQELIKKHSHSSYLTFTENHKNSIRMTTDLPAKWILDGHRNTFTGSALKGEYYTFQIGIYPVKDSARNIQMKFSGLNRDGKTIIPSSAFTCYNLEGTNWEGKPLIKKLSVGKGKVQALWVGFQVPEKIMAGTYHGTIRVKPENMEERVINLTMKIENKLIVNHGDNQPENMTRLRWLNSKIALNDETVSPYPPLRIDNQTIKCLGRDIVLDKNGFPKQIKSHFSGSVTKILPESSSLLESPVRFVIERNGKESKWKNNSFQFTKEAPGAIEWQLQNETNGFNLTGNVRMEFDGNIDYKLTLTATKDIQVKDIRLEIPFKQEAARYMMGLGQPGGKRPKEINWKWNVENNQDGPWLGAVNIGMQARFRDTNYERPLNTNFYHDKPLNMPYSWYNNGKGGITINPANSGTVMLKSYSGSRTIKKGDKLHFYFNLLVTPFHTIDTKAHWANRYYHSYKPISVIKKYGADVINIHHATKINPYINYPFLRPGLMKAYIDSAHAEGMKVKIYYTVRELSNHACELFMLRSLGDEILSYGKGGGYSWLQEHLRSNYIAGWFVPQLKDAAVINNGISRWHNYYLEGLNWLVKNVGIDGLYIDDIAFDRTTMERVRKILKKENPGSLIDVHSANQFNPRDGYANSANLYLEHFPFIDRLWFGEYFDYNRSPDYWLIEVSGIPYGLMGEMLQDGGNPWRGMVYGMTARAPWSGDPAPIWKLWDDFGIQDAEMIGYWDPKCPVSTNNEQAKATVYRKKGETLVAIANWKPTDLKVTLNIDWKKLGIDPHNATIEGPFIKNFQPAIHFNIGEPISLSVGKGYLLIIKSK